MIEDVVGKELDGLIDPANKAASAWIKLAEGESVSGVLLGVSEEPERDGFKAQIVIEMRKKTGDVVKLALARHKSDGADSRYYAATRRWVTGDLVAVKFEKTLPATKPGHHPAKVYELFHKPGKPEWALERQASDQDGF